MHLLTVFTKLRILDVRGNPFYAPNNLSTIHNSDEHMVVLLNVVSLPTFGENWLHWLKGCFYWERNFNNNFEAIFKEITFRLLSKNSIHLLTVKQTVWKVFVLQAKKETLKNFNFFFALWWIYGSSFFKGTPWGEQDS